MDPAKVKELEEKCKLIRYLAVDTIATTGSGHVGGSLSAVEAVVTLYYHQMNIDPADPQKPGRDRFILSKGHSGPVLYAVLADKGYFDKSWLHTMNTIGTRLPSHVDRLKTPGVDMTAGSLGQGLSAAVGMAVGSRLAGDGAWIYCMVGDGEIQEGQIWEAAMFAKHEKLDHLICFLDWNKQQIDGFVEEMTGVGPIPEKWRAFGWNVIECAIELAKAHKGSPSMIVLDTVKGKGYSRAEQSPLACHSMSFTKEEHADALRELEGGLTNG